MPSIAFNRAALLVARPAVPVMPAPAPYQPPDLVRRAATNLASAAAPDPWVVLFGRLSQVGYDVPASIAAGRLIPLASAPASGGCGGRCGSHPSSGAPATPGGGGDSSTALALSSPLVMTGSESPTSGPLDLSQLPKPADVAGNFKTPPPAGAPATGKDNAVWLWLAVLAVLFYVLSEGKGGRHNW